MIELIEKFESRSGDETALLDRSNGAFDGDACEGDTVNVKSQRLCMVSRSEP